MRNREEIGQAIRDRRRAAGMSQEALAEHAGIPRTGLSAVEAGHQGLPLDTAHRIAEALGTTVGTLLGEKPTPPPPAPEDSVYEFTRFSGRQELIAATTVTFTPGGDLAFTHGDRIILAVRAGDWNNLRQLSPRN